MRDVTERLVVAAFTKEIRRGRPKSGGPGYGARHFVIEQVIRWAMRENNVRAHLPQEANDFFERPFVIKDKQIALFETVVSRADEGRRLCAFTAANAADFFWRQ